MIPKVFIVDDDEAIRDALTMLLQSTGFKVEAFASAEDYLAGDPLGRAGCLVLDVRLPGMQGTDLQAELNRRGTCPPIVFLSAHGNGATSERAMRAGAVDFLNKPVSTEDLIDRIQQALARNRHTRETLDELTERERQLLSLAVLGFSNQEIGRHLGISERSVEACRARVFEKTGAADLLELARWCEVCAIFPANSNANIEK